MYRIKKTLFFLFVLSIHFPGITQESWIRVYGDGNLTSGYFVIETYDKGYIFLGALNDYKYAWVLKTDINGEILWSKTIGKQGEFNIPINIEETSDKGYVISGSTTQYDTGYDPYILKLNSCAQPEWCKVMHSGGNNYGQYVKQSSDSGYLYLTRYPYSTHLNNRVQLTKFDSTGNIIWQQVYTNSDSLLFAEEGYEISIINNEHLLITGRCYYPHPGGTGGWMRPFLILTDMYGDLIWEIPWVYDGYFVGMARKSIVDTNGKIYSVGQNSLAYSAVPVILKTNIEGDQLYYNNIIENNIYSGGSSAICWMTDSTIIVSASWIEEPLGESNDAFFKLDTLGEVMDTMFVPSLSNSIVHIIQTFNDKFVSVGTNYSGEIGMYAFKINENLEYDSIYTQPMVYDSLCPISITTETFQLDCDILVDMDEPFTTKEGSKLVIYPNPATDKIKIQLPEYIVTSQQTQNFEVTKVHYRYKGKMELKVYDSFGREVVNRLIADNDEDIEMDVSLLKEGLYLVVFYLDNKLVCPGKFIKR